MEDTFELSLSGRNIEGLQPTYVQGSLYLPFVPRDSLGWLVSPTNAGTTPYLQGFIDNLVTYYLVRCRVLY